MRGLFTSCKLGGAFCVSWYTTALVNEIYFDVSLFFFSPEFFLVN